MTITKYWREAWWRGRHAGDAAERGKQIVTDMIDSLLDFRSTSITVCLLELDMGNTYLVRKRV
jgi:hypothetical protein